jgi:hypothetical protein
MVEITIPIVLQFVQSAALLVGIIYYITIMRNQKRNQELTLKAQEHIYQQLNSVESMSTWAEVMNMRADSYEEFLKEHDSSVNPESFGKRGHIWWSYNTIGALVRKGLINRELVGILLGPMITQQWEKWEDIIQGTRDREDPNMWIGFEYLYNEMIKVDMSEIYDSFPNPT